MASSTAGCGLCGAARARSPPCTCLQPGQAGKPLQNQRDALPAVQVLSAAASLYLSALFALPQFVEGGSCAALSLQAHTVCHDPVLCAFVRTFEAPQPALHLFSAPTHWSFDPPAFIPPHCPRPMTTRVPHSVHRAACTRQHTHWHDAPDPSPDSALLNRSYASNSYSLLRRHLLVLQT